MQGTRRQPSSTLTRETLERTTSALSLTTGGWMDRWMDGSIELVNESGRGWETLEKIGLDVAIFINYVDTYLKQ